MNPNLDKLNESFAELAALNAKRNVLLAQLHLWHQVMLQGIEADEVKAFGWNKWMFNGVARSKEEPWYEWAVGVENLRRGFIGKLLWYNYVVLKDGTKKPLNPFIKVPPGFEAVPIPVTKGKQNVS